MRTFHRHVGPIAIALLTLIPAAGAPQALQHRPADQNPRVVACRVMEAHTSRDPAVTVVLFHQREKVDAQRLRALLLRASDKPVEFQTGDGGDWRPAHVARLKYCFGRGLLILPESATPLADGATFLLRFPVASLGPAAP
ncbi:MAG TPA: hypothetical protein VJX29_14500 [Candidatus Acidoferrales bacterium]|nr:hypothetical protein [Candidatus Acidoferrales bacterium]